MTADQISFYREQFDRCWPWLERAVYSYGDTHRKDDVWAEIESGHSQFWPLPNSAIVTDIDVHPTGVRELRCWLAGGELTELALFERVLCDFGRTENCARITIAGRRGWLRSLPKYREAVTVMVKDL